MSENISSILMIPILLLLLPIILKLVGGLEDVVEAGEGAYSSAKSAATEDVGGGVSAWDIWQHTSIVGGLTKLFGW